MTWLAENPLAIWAAGAIALTMAIIVYFQTRTFRSQMGILAVVLVTALLLLAERMIETPREAVARTLNEIAAAVRDNDMPAVLRYVVPSATVLQKEVTTYMPLFEVERAAIVGTPKIGVDETAKPLTATVECRGMVTGMLKKDGMKGGQMAHFQLTLVESGDHWLVTAYSTDANWRASAK